MRASPFAPRMADLDDLFSPAGKSIIVVDMEEPGQRQLLALLPALARLARSKLSSALVCFYQLRPESRVELFCESIGPADFAFEAALAGSTPAPDCGLHALLLVAHAWREAVARGFLAPSERCAIIALSNFMEAAPSLVLLEDPCFEAAELGAREFLLEAPRFTLVSLNRPAAPRWAADLSKALGPRCQVEVLAASAVDERAWALAERAEVERSAPGGRQALASAELRL